VKFENQYWLLLPSNHFTSSGLCQLSMQCCIGTCWHIETTIGLLLFW